MADYAVKLTDLEGEQLEQQARERGYESVSEYIRALVEADALVAALRDDWQDADESPDVLEAELRQAWHEIKTGNTLPISALWDTLADNE